MTWSKIQNQFVVCVRFFSVAPLLGVCVKVNKYVRCKCHPNKTPSQYWIQSPGMNKKPHKPQLVKCLWAQLFIYLLDFLCVFVVVVASYRNAHCKWHIIGKSFRKFFTISGFLFWAGLGWAGYFSSASLDKSFGFPSNPANSKTPHIIIICHCTWKRVLY